MDALAGLHGLMPAPDVCVQAWAARQAGIVRLSGLLVLKPWGEGARCMSLTTWREPWSVSPGLVQGLAIRLAIAQVPSHGI